MIDPVADLRNPCSFILLSLLGDLGIDMRRPCQGTTRSKTP